MVYEVRRERWNNEVAPEEAQPGTDYAITFNPDGGNPAFDDSVNKLYKGNVSMNMVGYLSAVKTKVFDKLRYAEVRVCLEISRLGRMHFHGWIRILNVPMFYLLDLQHLMGYGTFSICNIKDTKISDKYSDWTEYVQKGLHLWQEMPQLVNPWVQSAGWGVALATAAPIADGGVGEPSSSTEGRALARPPRKVKQKNRSKLIY